MGIEAMQAKIHDVLVSCCRDLRQRSCDRLDVVQQRIIQLSEMANAEHLDDDDRDALRSGLRDAEHQREAMEHLRDFAEAAESELERGAHATFIEMLQVAGRCPEGTKCQGRRFCTELLNGAQTNALRSIAQLISSDDIA